MTTHSNPPAIATSGEAQAGTGHHETIAAPHSLYIPSLDGIRTLSFFLVFLSHAGLGTLIPGGFGVTVFFLLSGFLITTLLRMEFARNQRISLRDFYLRRLLRIFPPLYLAIGLAIVLVIIQPEPKSFPVAGTLSQVFQVSNYYQIFSDHGRVLPGTGVFWSLAIEEHFYLLFPLLYLWLARRLTAHRQALILIGLCAAALAWRCALIYFLGASSNRTYYGTDTRFDAMLFGCILAVAANPVLGDPIYRWLVDKMKWVLPVAVASLLGSFLYRDEQFRETFRYTVQGLALMPFFIAAIHYQQAWPVRLLNLPLMRFLGVLSYSLYLCHVSILEFVYRSWSMSLLASGLLTLALSLLFATAVHYGVERPCTKIRKRLSKALSQ